MSGVVLSLWDNLSGPRVEQVWYQRGVPRELFLQSATFTLNGEMLDMTEDADDRVDSMEHKFLMLPQYFSVCVLFCAYFNGQLTKLSLACMFNPSVMDSIFCMLHVVNDRTTIPTLIHLIVDIQVCDIWLAFTRSSPITKGPKLHFGLSKLLSLLSSQLFAQYPLSDWTRSHSARTLLHLLAV